MRDIKFRAWVKSMKRFYNITGFMEKTDRTHGYKVISLFFGDGFGSWGADDVTLMQFTGLKDKNGEEIYEGDILRKGEGLPMHRPEQKPKQEIVGSIKKVIFHEGCFQITKSNSSQNYRLSSVVIRYYGFEVAGNIYENPDLLSNEQNVQASVATDDDSSNKAD